MVWERIRLLLPGWSLYSQCSYWRHTGASSYRLTQPQPLAGTGVVMKGCLVWVWTPPNDGCLETTSIPFKGEETLIDKGMDVPKVVEVISLEPRLESIYPAFKSLGFFKFLFKYLFLFIYLASRGLVAAHRIFSLCCDMCDLVPQPETQSEPNALEVWRPSHWTTRHVLQVLVFLHSSDSKDREQVACSFLS